MAVRHVWSESELWSHRRAAGSSPITSTTGPWRRRTTATMLAHVASPDERAEWWARITAVFPHYAGYQGRTDRAIPLVRLAPARTGALRT
jgi:hypothetical protein